MVPNTFVNVIVSPDGLAHGLLASRGLGLEKGGAATNEASVTGDDFLCWSPTATSFFCLPSSMTSKFWKQKNQPETQIGRLDAG